MRPAARVASSIELLEQWEAAGPFPFDRFAQAWLAQRRYAGSKDRAAILDLCYALLRRRAGLDAELAGRGVAPSWRLRALAVEGHAALQATEHGVNPTETERALLADFPSVGGGLPEWLARALPAVHLPKLDQPAPVDLRVRGDRTALAAELEATFTPFAPSGVRLLKRAPLLCVAEGRAEVQDEGSQLVALAALPVDGLDVLDRCAGAGGKTLALAEAGFPRRLVAADVSAARLAGLEERLARGRHGQRIERVVAPAGDAWLATQRFDVVFVDAPCSGTGTLRRAPDLAWRLRPEDVARYVALQAAILDEVAPLVRPGGRLVYATCSLLPAENERQTQAFLSRHGEFEAASLPLPGELWGPGPPARHELTLSPALTATDGFYVALFQRT